MTDYGKAGEVPGRFASLSYTVDLTNATEEDLAAIKNRLVESIARAVAEELKTGEPSASLRAEHNRHSRTIDW